MKYTEEISKNGVINRHPILTDEEREELHQEFLRTVYEISQKHKKKAVQDKIQR